MRCERTGAGLDTWTMGGRAARAYARDPGVMSIVPLPIRGLTALCACALALLAVASPAFALPASTEQVPLELRPSQGPPGSDTIVYATGFTAAESVHVYV